MCWILENFRSKIVQFVMVLGVGEGGEGGGTRCYAVQEKV